MTGARKQRLTSARAEKLARNLKREGFRVTIKRDEFRRPVRVVGVKRLAR